MEKALFLLQDWLAVGAAVVVFSGIGLLVGKWIWGRQGVRLAKAVDANMNLLSQWAALGQTQHVLFKKLRTRWQADRDSWGEQSATWSGQLRGKDKAIRKLIAKVKRLKEAEPLVVGKGSKVTEEQSEAITALKKQIETAESELRAVTAELSDVRSGDVKKTDALEALEAERESRIVAEKGAVEFMESSNFQLSVLLRQRTIEMTKLGRSQMADANQLAAEAGAIEDAIEENARELRAELDEAVSTLAEIQDRYDERVAEIGVLENRLKDADSIDLETKKQSDELESIIGDRDNEIEDAGKELKGQLNIIAELRSSIAEFEEIRKAQGTQFEDEIDNLKVELADVRQDYDSKIKEIEVLEGQAEELESIVDDRNREIEGGGKELKLQLNVISGLRSSIAELEGELDGQDVESVDLVAELKEKVEQVEFLNGRMTEMESAMADRYAEVNRVRAEWKQVDERAEKLDGESERLTREVAEQNTELERLQVELEERVSELGPLNTKIEELSTSLDQAEKDHKNVRSEFDEKELNLAVAEEGASILRKSLREQKTELEHAKEELKSTASKLETKELLLASANEGASNLRKSLQKKKAELKGAKSDLSALKSELEERAKSANEQKAELADAISRLDENDQNLAQRDKSIKGMEETVDRIEAEADSLKILLEEGKRNTADLESKIIEFEDLIQSKDSEIGTFTHEIRNLVESVEGPDPDKGGGKRTGELDRLLEGGSENVAGEATKVHIRILSDTVADLQNRLVEAEGSYGVCEQEKAIVTEKVEGIREKFGVRLLTRNKQIQILKEKVSAQQAKLKELTAGLASSAVADSMRGSFEKKTIAIEDMRGVRNTVPITADTDEIKEKGEKIWLSVHFEEKSVELESAELSKIDDAARKICESGVPFSVSVEGFSSIEGSSDYNEFLSAGRADAVRERLIDVGVVQSDISTQGQGEHPEYSDSDSSWKARRVEISFVSETAFETVS